MKNFNFKKLSNDQLHYNTKNLVGRERELLLDILDHLREIEFRKLFSILGYASLFEYAVCELKFSEAAAGRRVSAMRLLKEIPVLEESIQTGELTLSNINTVQSFLREEKKNAKTYTLLEKQKLFESSKNLSQRECQRKLAEISPQSVKNKERVTFINSSQVEVQITISKTLLTEIEELKNLISHELVTGELAEVLEICVRKNLKEIKKRKQGVGVREKAQAGKTENPTPTEKSAILTPMEKRNSQTTEAEKSRHIPIDTQRAVRHRAGHFCEFVDPLTKRRCTSQWKLEFDHQVPFSFGGPHIEENLRLLCANHHQFFTAQVFG